LFKTCTNLAKFNPPRNYDNWLTGAAGAAFMISGALGGGIQGAIAQRTGRLVEVSKTFLNVGVLFIIATLCFLRKYESEAAIIIFSIL
jgi:hypothetical protein